MDMSQERVGLESCAGAMSFAVKELRAVHCIFPLSSIFKHVVAGFISMAWH